MAFHVIIVAADLDDEARAEAIAAGPPAVAAPESYPDLLARAGFRDIDAVDVTDEYRVTATSWLRESARSREQLEEIFGAEDFRQSQQERSDVLSAIERGLLRRFLFVARAG